MSSRMITAFGKTQSIMEWARETGISRSTIASRLDRWGWSVEDALTKGNQHPERTLTAFGKTQTLTEWEQETGINRYTIKARISKHGWTAERALTVKDGHRAYNMRKRMSVAKKQKKALDMCKNQGLNPQEIALKLDVHRNTAYQYLREAGYGIEERTLEKIKEVYNVYQVVKNIDETAEITELSQSTVYKYLSMALKDRSIVKPKRPRGLCDCGKPVAHKVKITVGTGATEYLDLCNSCHELFVEIESDDYTDVPQMKTRTRF